MHFGNDLKNLTEMKKPVSKKMPSKEKGLEPVLRPPSMVVTLLLYSLLQPWGEIRPSSDPQQHAVSHIRGERKAQLNWEVFLHFSGPPGDTLAGRGEGVRGGI